MPALERSAFMVQKAILKVSHQVHSATKRGRAKDISWVVGPDELALMVAHISEAVPRSHSVSLSSHSFYARRYDTQLRSSRSARLDYLLRIVNGPWLMGKLMTRAKGFIYIGASGFLLSGQDNRAAEFEFVKSNGLKLVCYFTGDDIRAPRLMHELEARTGQPNISTFLSEVSSVFDSDEYDATKRHIAASADRFADVIFTAAADQLSYLTRPTEPFLYFYPDSQFRLLERKFVSYDRLVVLHAPSSPALKGTPLVRDAVERLRADGYDFEYVELLGVDNETVLRELGRAHIVLNQFYAFIPGVFGIEALASTCAMLCSADERIETGLPAGANDAWLVTKSDEIHQNLRRLLDDPLEMRELAVAGYRWALENVSKSADEVKMRRILAAALDRGDEPIGR